MRRNQQTSAGDGANRPRQLDRRDRNRALTDAHGNRLARIPLLFEVADFPLFRRHHSGHFLRQIDAGFLPQSKHGGILRDAADSQPLSQRVERRHRRTDRSLC